MSAPHKSVGISTMHGPPRPLRRRENARRMMFDSSLATTSGSADFATPRISRTAL